MTTLSTKWSKRLNIPVSSTPVYGSADTTYAPTGHRVIRPVRFNQANRTEWHLATALDARLNSFGTWRPIVASVAHKGFEHT